MSGVTLPAGWRDRADVVQAGLAATGLVARALSWAHEHRTYGWVPTELALEFCAGDDAPIRRAVKFGLLVHEIRGGQPGFYLPDRDEEYGRSGPAQLAADDARPPTGQAVAYVLYDGLEPVYIGSTGHFSARLARHRRDKTFDRWTAYPCADREAAYLLEDQLLAERFPPLNRRRSAR